MNRAGKCQTCGDRLDAEGKCPNCTMFAKPHMTRRSAVAREKARDREAGRPIGTRAKKR